jgi:hypothetical protein
MTVKELIEKLKTFNPDLPVYDSYLDGIEDAYLDGDMDGHLSIERVILE